MFEPETLTKLVKIIFADLLLAGDNALIIALATRSLPRKQQFFGRIFGAGGAVVLRVIFVILISHLLAVPFLQLAGGLALLWIAAKLVRPQEEAVHEAAEGGSTETKAAKAVTLRAAVGMIIVADITMSFDNVVAIANIAADPITRKLHTGLVIFGLLFSIPLVVWGSQLISKLMERFKWIIWLGGGVLGHVAATIIFQDRKVMQWMGLPVPADGQDFQLDQILSQASPAMAAMIKYLPWILAVLLFVYGWWRNRIAEADKTQSKA